MSKDIFGDYATLGYRATLGNYATLGDRATLGDDATLGDRATLGDWATLGDRLTAEGVRVYATMTMSNVDGSGRRIQIYVHPDGILIRAGCFRGSLDEFCDKARLEGKVRYAKVVRAAAEALAEDCRERGITGGWGEE